MGRIAWVLTLVFVVGCGADMSAADPCRMGNAFGRMGQANNRTANAVEDLRCDEIERDERAEGRASVDRSARLAGVARTEP